MRPSFDARKAAQIAAFFCDKAGGTINVVKLVKLFYLADRLGMERSGASVSCDHFVAMRHGPVVSDTYNLIKGEEQSPDWENLITDRENHTVGLARPIGDDDDDMLSRFDLRMLEETWGRFGGEGPWELVRWTHDHCPEWENPGDTSETIPIERIFKFLNPEAANNLTAQFNNDMALRAALADD